MIKKLRIWLLSVWRWYRHRVLYVIADPSDNSITMSRALCDIINVFSLDRAQVFVFSISGSEDGKTYAFTVNPDFDRPTQLCNIQYNSKYRTIGFETLCPTVTRIFYDYGLCHSRKVRLSVEIGQTELTDCPKRKVPVKYYKILRPYDQFAS